MRSASARNTANTTTSSCGCARNADDGGRRQVGVDVVAPPAWRRRRESGRLHPRGGHHEQYRTPGRQRCGRPAAATSAVTGATVALGLREGACRGAARHPVAVARHQAVDGPGHHRTGAKPRIHPIGRQNEPASTRRRAIASGPAARRPSGATQITAASASAWRTPKRVEVGELPRRHVGPGGDAALDEVRAGGAERAVAVEEEDRPGRFPGVAGRGLSGRGVVLHDPIVATRSLTTVIDREFLAEGRRPRSSCRPTARS